MKKISLLLFLAIPSLLSAQVPADSGNFIIAWMPPDQGNPLDHYIWTYTINGVDDSIIGWSSAQTTRDSSAVLTNVGDWAVFKIRAISTLSDTSIQVISDTAILLESQGIDTSDHGATSQPVSFGLQAYPNPSGQSGLSIRWHIDRDDHYSIEIYDILGAKLKTIRRERMAKGSYSQLVGNNLAAGVYFAIISNYDERRVVKFTVLR
jgi:hypothetical protein